MVVASEVGGVRLRRLMTSHIVADAGVEDKPEIVGDECRVADIFGIADDTLNSKILPTEHTNQLFSAREFSHNVIDDDQIRDNATFVDRSE